MTLSRDRRSLPVQLRDELRGLIEQDGLRAGDRLATEAEIAARFDVGRTTVREALKLLEQDGLISVRHGRGRFVTSSPALQRPLTRLESVTEMMAALGYTVTNRVLSVREAAATDAELAALQLPPSSPVMRLERLRLQDENPLIYSIDVIPRGLFRMPLNSIDWAGSLSGLLEAEGYAFTTAQAEIRASALPSGMSRKLGRGSRECWLLMVQVHLTDTGKPVVFSHDYHRGDVFTFHVPRRRQ